MSAFDAAVSELLASMDDGPTVHELEGRGRRRQRRRVLIRVLVVSAAAALAVGVAASVGHDTTAPQIAVSPTTSVRTAAASTGCASISRDEAVTRIAQLSDIQPGINLDAKLVSMNEARRAIPTTGLTLFSPLPTRGLLWLVYAQGSIRSDLSALYYMDVTNGRVIGMTAKPGPVVPNWAALPSHVCTTLDPARVQQRQDTHLSATPTTTTPTDAAPTPNSVPGGPHSQALRTVVAPIVPAGALLLAAFDLVSREQIAELTYVLPSGQQLHIVRERLLTNPGSPQELIRDPSVDSLTQLPTGSRLLRLGHSDYAQQVILGRPNGTMINVTLRTPMNASAPQPSETQRRSSALANLNWLTTAIERNLDRPSSDVN
jgi:hypothetical protein